MAPTGNSSLAALLVAGLSCLALLLSVSADPDRYVRSVARKTGDENSIVTDHAGWTQAKKSARKLRNTLRNNKALKDVGHMSWLADPSPQTSANLAAMLEKSKQHQHQILDTASTCGDGDAFTIAAPSVPRIEGCYFDTGIDLWGETCYSQTGTTDVGQAFMVAYKEGCSDSDDTLDSVSTDSGDSVSTDSGDSVSTDSGDSFSSDDDEEIDVWIAVYVETAVEAYGYCVSLMDAASDTHPADVGTWYCDLELTGTDVEEATDDEFDVDCGCT